MYKCTRVRATALVSVRVRVHVPAVLSLQVLPLYITCTRACVLARAHVPTEISIYRYILGTPGAYPVLHMYFGSLTGYHHPFVRYHLLPVDYPSLPCCGVLPVVGGPVQAGAHHHLQHRLTGGPFSPLSVFYHMYSGSWCFTSFPGTFKVLRVRILYFRCP